MFGNTTGWGLSAIIAAVMIAFLYYFAVPPKPSPATGAAVFKVAHAKIALPGSPTDVAPAGTEECDAGKLYRQAIDGYKSHARVYERFQNKPISVSMDQMPEMQDVLRAAHCKNFALFSGRPAELVNYDNEEPSLTALNTVGNAMNTMGLLRGLDKQPDEAKKLWEAVFQLGARLYGDHITFRELEVGHDLMQGSAQSLRNLAKEQGDKPRVAQLQAFMTDEGSYQLKLNEAYKWVGAVDEAHAGQYAGDILSIAKDPNADPVWRVEALKHLGHYRYNALTKGDQLSAKHTLASLSQDTTLPPSVRAAAQAGNDLTLRQHNLVGGSVD